MKGTMNKNFIQKIVIGILIVLSFNFIAPTYSRADFGGVLMGPIIDLASGLCDAITAGLQFFMYDGGIDSGDGISGGFLVDANTFNKSKDKYPGMAYDDSEGNAQYEIESSDLDRGWLAGIGSSFFGSTANADNFGIPISKYSPEKIFSGKVPALDVNFINPRTYSTSDGYTSDQAKVMNEKSITKALQNTIATWYKALRNLAIVGLLSVLIYVGIRILITSVASDKAKYKQMLLDWLIALCLLFFLHYIMNFALTMTDMIVDGIGKNNQVAIKVIDNGETVTEFNTDLMGFCRFQVQYADLGKRLIYLIMYVALVVYTCIFTWTYVKRAITMAFLTLMAPIVSLTYPIDKISDGKAQAFNMWLKEYIFNALLQPFHLIIYTIFLGSAMQIAVNNPIYAILFLAFITPAEKILRKMFGFEKSSTAAASFGGAFGGAAAFNIVSKGAQKLLGGKSSKGGKGSSGNSKIRTSTQIKDKDAIGDDASAFANARTIGNAGNIEQEGELLSGGNDLNGSEPRNNAIAIGSNSNGNYPGLVGLDGKPLVKETTQATQLSPANSDSNSNAEENKTPSRIRGIANIAKKPIRQAKEGAYKYFGTKEGRIAAAKATARFAGRTAIRGGAAVGLGAVGLGIGITGNDLEDVAKIGMAGATLGGTVVGGAAANAGESLVTSASTAFREGYYGDENTAVMARQSAEFKLNQENRDFFGEEFEVKGKELDKVMDKAAFYNNQGITDNKNIKQTIKLEDAIKKEMTEGGIDAEESGQMAKEQAATISKLADNYNTEKLRTDEKYQQGVYRDFRNSLKAVNPSMTESQLKVQSEQMMRLLKKYKKID